MLEGFFTSGSGSELSTRSAWARRSVRFSAILLAAFLAAVPAGIAAGPEPSVFREIDEITRVLTSITGWKAKRRVPASVLSEGEFRKYAEKRLNKVTRPEDLRVEELTLKMLGLVPANYDLKSSTLDLMSEQAAAFYDFEKKRLYLVGQKRSSEEDRAALVHELAHALADQHFSLKEFLQNDELDDEEVVARQAAAEGQATWLTWAYINFKQGGQAQPPRYVLDTAGVAAAAAGSNFPVFQSSPLYVQESLLFPYTQGLKFTDAVYRKLGRAGFPEVFQRAPRSTREILHPEDYLRGWKASQPSPPVLPASHEFKNLGEGKLGELDHSILLRQFASEKEATLALKLRGSSYALFEHRKEGFPILAYASEWETEEAAAGFFSLYRKILTGKDPKTQFEGETEQEMRGSGERGRFTIRREGVRVTALEGLR
jgi:hypothetical protein